MKCCEAIKNHGGGHPALFNDEVIIPSPDSANVPGVTKNLRLLHYRVLGGNLRRKGDGGCRHPAIESGTTP